MEKRIALVTGATGLVGKQLMDQLLAIDYYTKIKVFTRRPLNYKDNRIEEFVIDFDKLENHKDDMDAHDHFCCLGTTLRKAGSKEAFVKIDHDYPLQLAEIAMGSPSFVQFIVVTAVGANSSSPLFYNQVKGQIEDSLMELGMKRLHIFQPSLLLGPREDFRFMENVAKFFSAVLTFFVIGTKRRLWAIKGSDVAKAMLTVAKRSGDGVYVYKPSKIRKIAQ